RAAFDGSGGRLRPLAARKPAGGYVMNDLYRAGGTPAVMKALLEAGLLHGDCLTVTGGTLAQNLDKVPSIYKRKQNVVKPLNDPLHPSGHLVILHGNLAPE